MIFVLSLYIYIYICKHIYIYGFTIGAYKNHGVGSQWYSKAIVHVREPFEVV